MRGSAEAEHAFSCASMRLGQSPSEIDGLDNEIASREIDGLDNEKHPDVDLFRRAHIYGIHVHDIGAHMHVRVACACCMCVGITDERSSHFGY